MTREELWLGGEPPWARLETIVFSWAKDQNGLTYVQGDSIAYLLGHPVERSPALTDGWSNPPGTMGRRVSCPWSGRGRSGARLSSESLCPFLLQQ